jgi:hypothetical protein
LYGVKEQDYIKTSKISMDVKKKVAGFPNHK